MNAQRGRESGAGAKRYRLGIVLSGGGTRGIAHIGVLRALGEHGMSPDCVAGTSAGAIVGALYAAGYPPDEMVEFFRTKSPFRLSKVSLTGPGIIDTAKIVSDFEEYFPENSFAALGKKLSMVATDIVRGEPVVFDSGPLIPAILASSAVPMVFTPPAVDGRLFSDGGIVNNFPVELLEGRCEVLLGVYASPLRPVEESDLGSSLAVGLRAFEVGMFHTCQVKFDRCDALICPAGLSRFGAFDTSHADDIERVGYDAASAAMPSIERSLRAPGSG